MKRSRRDEVEDYDQKQAQSQPERVAADRKQTAGPSDKLIRVYCDGIYDLFHFGHARALEQAKKSFPNVYLLVGVCNDEVTHKMKGKTVMTADERAESLRHCKWVDEVVENAPWIITQDFLDKHQIDFVAHDDIPYQSEGVEDVYAFVKAQGKFLATQRTGGISTSDLITRIVRDYDKYVRRNLDRGVSPKELNVGFLKETEINVKKQLEKVKKNWVDTGKELWHTVETIDKNYQDFVKGFVDLFGGSTTDFTVWSPIRKNSNNNDNNNATSDAPQSDSSHTA